MKAKSRWFWLLLSLPLIAGIVGAGWFYLAPVPAAPARSFADAGYLTLRMTQDYHAPGSIYKVQDETETFVNLHPTCEVKRSEFEDVVQIHRTVDRYEAVARKLSAGAQVAPKNWGKLELGIDLQGVQDIKVIYANSKIELLSTEMIQSLRDGYLRRDGCFAAVKYELEQGYEVCQTEAVIVSDLVYEVTHSAKGGLGFEGTLEGVMGTEGEIRVESGHRQRIKGEKMYHAVRLHRSKKRNTCIILNTTTADRGQAARAATNLVAQNPG